MPAARLFFINLILLSLLGLFFVFEASTVESFKLFGHQYYFFKQQALWLLLSFVVFFAIARIKVSNFEKYALHLYIVGMILLVLTLIPGIGLKLNGARRWLALPFGTLQTVEPVKLILINLYAYLLSKKIELKSFVFFVLWPTILILLQPDFGSLMILVATSLTMYFLAGANLKSLLLIVGVGAGLALMVVLLSPYRRDRLITFLNPSENTQDESYHIRQITLALGGGSWLGRGIGNSLQKYSYVPEASSDSIFAIIAEEVGFVGSSIIIVMFATYFILAQAMIREKVLSKFEHLLFYGILAWQAVQIIFNLSAVVVLLPLSGMPLPFFSQGGSALLMTFIGSGVLLSIAKHAKIKK